MASSCRFEIKQSPNPLEAVKIEKILNEIVKRAGSSGKTYWIMHFEVVQEAPDAIVDIVEGETDTFDGTVAADEVDIVSSNAADKGMSGTLYGITENDVIYGEAFTLDAADATTPITTTTKWKRLIAMTLDAACAGNITVSEEGGAVAQYMLVTAGDLHSITTKTWVPDGYAGAVVSLVPTYEIANGAAPVFANGCNVGVNVNGTVKITGVTPENIGKDICSPQPFDLPHYDDGYMAIQHETMDTDANLTETIDVTYIIWEV